MSRLPRPDVARPAPHVARPATWHIGPVPPLRGRGKESRTMAKLVAILATTHHPFYYRTSQLPESEAPPFAGAWVSKVAAYRETLARTRPDVLVMIGSDHFHQLWLDNMPQFLVGKAPFY